MCSSERQSGNAMIEQVRGPERALVCSPEGLCLHLVSASFIPSRQIPLHPLHFEYSAGDEGNTNDGVQFTLDADPTQRQPRRNGCAIAHTDVDKHIIKIQNHKHVYSSSSTAHTHTHTDRERGGGGVGREEGGREGGRESPKHNCNYITPSAHSCNPHYITNQ